MPESKNLKEFELIKALIQLLCQPKSQCTAYEQLALVISIRKVLSSSNYGEDEMQEFVVLVCQQTQLIQLIKLLSTRLLEDQDGSEA